jgi:hypothetical protein
MYTEVVVVYESFRPFQVVLEDSKLVCVSKDAVSNKKTSELDV